MTRQAFVLHEPKLVLFWAQKAACTSLLHLVTRQLLGLPLDEIIATQPNPRAYLTDSGLLDRREHPEACALVTQEGYSSIALVRDPYDRLVSAFSNKFLFHNGVALRGQAQLEGFSLAFYHLQRKLLHDDAATKGPYHGLSFAEFVRTCCLQIGRRNGGEPALNAHFSTQIPFGLMDAGFRYDHLYTLDRLDAFLDRLRDITGVAAEMPRFNITPEADGTGDLSEVNSLEITARQSGVAKHQFASDALRLQVRSAFAPDYHYIDAHRTAG